jgi:hypothetical protein
VPGWYSIGAVITDLEQPDQRFRLVVPASAPTASEGSSSWRLDAERPAGGRRRRREPAPEAVEPDAAYGADQAESGEQDRRPEADADRGPPEPVEPGDLPRRAYCCDHALGRGGS